MIRRHDVATIPIRSIAVGSLASNKNLFSSSVVSVALASLVFVGGQPAWSTEEKHSDSLVDTVRIEVRRRVRPGKTQELYFL